MPEVVNAFFDCCLISHTAFKRIERRDSSLRFVKLQPLLLRCSNRGPMLIIERLCQSDLVRDIQFLPKMVSQGTDVFLRRFLGQLNQARLFRVFNPARGIAAGLGQRGNRTKQGYECSSLHRVGRFESDAAERIKLTCSGQPERFPCKSDYAAARCR
jgi:hypothetical protein